MGYKKSLSKAYKAVKGTSKEVFKDFVSYFYFTVDDKINSIKQKSMKNKYIKIRQNAIRYIIANEKAITSEICKNQKNKKWKVFSSF